MMYDRTTVDTFYLYTEECFPHENPQRTDSIITFLHKLYRKGEKFPGRWLTIVMGENFPNVYPYTIEIFVCCFKTVRKNNR